MLARSLVIMAIAGTAGIVAPKVVPLLLGNSGGYSVEMAEPEAATTPTNTSSRPSTGAVVIKSDNSGHFRASFRVNGKSIPGLIDTGATLVAINRSTARSLGYGANSLEFKHPINTANGQTMGAYVQLPRMEIGPIRVENVDAFVLEDKALSTTLVGMSFLKKLGSYSVEDGALRLKR